jgi:hypothetical protein
MPSSYNKKRYSKNKKQMRNKSRKQMKGGCGTCQVMKGGKKGGSALLDSLAYTGKPSPHYLPNPNLAYTGGYKNPNLGAPNAKLSSAYPNPGVSGKFNFLNPLQTQSGGKYPNGLTGDDWSVNPETWPGVNGIDGDRNHYALNTYNNDVSRQMVDLGPPPFENNLVGGKSRKRRGGRGYNNYLTKLTPAPYHASGGKRRKKTNTRNRKGGLILNSNGLLQDVVNLGRIAQTGVGGLYNGLKGYPGPVSPLPWKGQLTNSNLK